MKKMIVSFLKKNMLGMLTLFVMQADAQVLAMWNNASDGFRSVARIQSGAPSNNPSRINELVDDHTVAKLFKERHGSEIEKFMGQLKTRIVLVSSDRQIIYQNYATRSMRNSTPLGYSMSKSVAAMTIGHAICSNSKVSIQSKVDSLIPRLKGTSWGDSTIEDILLMKSGSAKTIPENNGWQSEEVAAIHRPVYLGHHNSDIVDLMIKHDLKEFRPGTSYQYNNYDTLVLGLLVEAITQRKFYEYFFDTVWKEVAAAKTGAWIVNGFDQTFTSFGFSASPEDWLRLGHYVIDQIDSQTCIGKFLQIASEPKETKTWVKTRCYGYQIWNWCRKDAFFFFGFGGQFLIIRPEKKWVAYVHQTTHDNDAKILGILYESLNLLN